MLARDELGVPVSRYREVTIRAGPLP